MSTPPPLPAVLLAAQAYVAGGLSVIPMQVGRKDPLYERLPLVWDDGDQRTKHTWSPYRDRCPTPEELRRWFHDDHGNVAIVGGKASGGVVVLDLEYRWVYEHWRRNVLELLDEEVITGLPLVATGKGKHLYLRMAEPVGNLVLARRPRDPDEQGRPVWELLAETRGEGQLAIAPPSRHPSGATYTLERGTLTQDGIPLLTPTQVLAIFDAARALVAPEDDPLAETTAGKPWRGTHIIEQFNHQVTIETVLATYGYTRRGDSSRFNRPGGESGSVAVRNERSYHFNPTDPLHTVGASGRVRGHSAFSVLCELGCHGDLDAALDAAALALGMAPSTRRPASGSQPRVVDEAGSVSAADRADRAAQATECPTWPYWIEAGKLMYYQKAENPRMQLANFTARIIAETEVDDGYRREARYTIEATCGDRTEILEMTREEFEGDTAIQRIVAALGVRARLHPRAHLPTVKDAIKAFSDEVVSRRVYGHTGWVDDHRRYLFGNGSVDATGWHTGEGARLPEGLEHYQLDPTILTTVPLATALAAVDRLLDLAPPEVIIPLVGAVLLAPIAWTLDVAVPMVHLYGKTGTHKTALTCVATALWGGFAPDKPTESWGSTHNAIQKLGWHLPDAPMILDDFKRNHMPPKHVTSLLQSYGDRMGRRRLDANTETRKTYPIRAIILSSGELVPDGEASALARMVTIPLAPGHILATKLTQVQADAPLLPVVTVAYLRWLATQPDVLSRTRGHFEQHRGMLVAQLTAVDAHATNPGRIAANIAALACAWYVFGQFVREGTYWPSERVRLWQAHCTEQLNRLAASQLHLVTEERYTQQFFTALRSLVRAGQAQLQNLGKSTGELVKPPALIGGYDAEGTYIVPEAFDLVVKARHQMGLQLPFNKAALLQMLQDEGLFVTTDDKARKPQKAIRRYIDGSLTRCWHLPPGMLFDTDPEDEA